MKCDTDINLVLSDFKCFITGDVLHHIPFHVQNLMCVCVCLCGQGAWWGVGVMEKSQLPLGKDQDRLITVSCPLFKIYFRVPKLNTSLCLYIYLNLLRVIYLNGMTGLQNFKKKKKKAWRALVRCYECLIQTSVVRAFQASIRGNPMLGFERIFYIPNKSRTQQQ